VPFATHTTLPAAADVAEEAAQIARQDGMRLPVQFRAGFVRVVHVRPAVHAAVKMK
jgi:hypothetical protein